MAKRLIVVGAGNVGGFLAYNIEDFGNFEFLGFLDDDIAKHGKTYYGYRVLGGVDDVVRYISDDLCVAVGIAAPKAKRAVLDRLAPYGLQYPNFVAKNAWVSRSVKMGRGNILYPGVSVNYETIIGDFVLINLNCALGHNSLVSRYCTLAPGVNLAGYTRLEEGVEIGIGAATRQRVTLGRYSVVGGQAMVIRDVPEKSLVVGVPGRVSLS